jgi:hypothetical protein
MVIETDDKEASLRVVLKKEQLKRFRKIKDKLGLEQDTEVVRFLVNKVYFDFYPDEKAD